MNAATDLSAGLAAQRGRRGRTAVDTFDRYAASVTVGLVYHFDRRVAGERTTEDVEQQLKRLARSSGSPLGPDVRLKTEAEALFTLEQIEERAAAGRQPALHPILEQHDIRFVLMADVHRAITRDKIHAFLHRGLVQRLADDRGHVPVREPTVIALSYRRVLARQSARVAHGILVARARLFEDRLKDGAFPDYRAVAPDAPAVTPLTLFRATVKAAPADLLNGPGPEGAVLAASTAMPGVRLLRLLETTRRTSYEKKRLAAVDIACRQAQAFAARSDDAALKHKSALLIEGIQAARDGFENALHLWQSHLDGASDRHHATAVRTVADADHALRAAEDRLIGLVQRALMPPNSPVAI